MARTSNDRPSRLRFAFRRRRRLTVVAVAAPLAVLLAATAIAAAPTIKVRTSPGPAEQATDAENPNFRRVVISGPSATIQLLDQEEPSQTGALSGEVDLARPEGDEAMFTANLVVGTTEGGEGDFGRVSLAIRPGPLADFRYDTSAQSIIFNPGIEFEAESVPGLGTPGDPVFLYTNPIRLVPKQTAEQSEFPPWDTTFIPGSTVLLWQGEEGVTGSEPVALLTEFELTVTRPG